MASPSGANGPNADGPRRRYEAHSFSIDEFINWFQAWSRTHRGRWVITVSCLVAAVAVAVIPIMRRSANVQPTVAIDKTTVSAVTIPATTSTIVPASPLLPIVSTPPGPSQRIGPPLTTDTPTTAAPPRTLPTTTVPTPTTTPPPTTPVTTPTTAPAPPPPTPTTGPPDTGVVVPYNPAP